MNWTHTDVYVPTSVNLELIIPWIIAVAALVIGPMVQLRIAKRQIEATAMLAKQEITYAADRAHKQVVAPMRQAWISNLRQKVSTAVAEASVFHAMRNSRSDDPVEWRRLGLVIHATVNEIDLMLNRTEQDHMQFLIDLRSWCADFSSAKDWDDDKAKRQADTQFHLLNQCSAILKREWEVVKTGE